MAGRKPLAFPAEPVRQVSSSSGEGEFRLLDGKKSAAMDRTRPMFLEFSEVQLGAIAFMLGKGVAGVVLIHLDHDAVTRHLGDDTRRRDAEAERIAAHQRGVRDRK